MDRSRTRGGRYACIWSSLNAEKQTGYLRTFLGTRERSVILPRALVVTGHADSPAMPGVVDLVQHPSGTIVHFDVLPDAIET